MGVGHVVDANTVALWRFDETTHQDYQNFADATGNYGASQATNGSRPGITGGPAGTDRAAMFSGTQSLTFTPDTAFTDAMSDADWTWEAWVYLEELQFGTWIDIGAVGEAPATDVLARIHILSSGFLRIFWEHSGGTNVTISQTSGTAVQRRQWTYVAITADFNSGTGDRTVNFFVDSGTSQGSGSGTSPTDGSSSTGFIGAEFDGGGDIIGAIGRMRLSTVVRTSTELNDNATDPNFEFANDANTLALWQFDEAPEIEDISGNGHHLTSVDKANEQPRIADSLLKTDGGKARLHALIQEGYVAYYRSQLQNMMLGSWTIEWWGLIPFQQTHGICAWGTGGASEPNNFLIDLRFITSGDDYVLDLLWEEGAGTNVTATGTSAIVTDGSGVDGATSAQEIHHYAVVFENVTGTTRDIHIYRDATLIETISGVTRPTGGSEPDGTLRGLWIGRDRNQARWQGYLDDMRLSDKARSASEIQASFDRGSQTFSRSIPALPRQKPV